MKMSVYLSHAVTKYQLLQSAGAAVCHSLSYCLTLISILPHAWGMRMMSTAVMTQKNSIVMRYSCLCFQQRNRSAGMKKKKVANAAGKSESSENWEPLQNRQLLPVDDDDDGHIRADTESSIIVIHMGGYEMMRKKNERSDETGNYDHTPSSSMCV